MPIRIPTTTFVAIATMSLLIPAFAYAAFPIASGGKVQVAINADASAPPEAVADLCRVLGAITGGTVEPSDNVSTGPPS